MSAADLDRRARKVLQAVVSEYLEHGDAVSSRVVTHRHAIGASPATVRHVMADLEQLGLLEQRHTSGGRVPTTAGLRFFIDSLLRVRGLPDETKEEIRQSLRASGDQGAEALLARASRMLSHVTHHAAIVALPSLGEQVIAHIEFLALRHHKVLCVLVMADGRIENRILTVTEELTGKLERASAHLQRLLSGLTLDQMQERVRAELGELKHDYDHELSLALRLGSSLVELSPKPDEGQVIVSGQSNLLDEGEAALGRARELFRALEDKRIVLGLLERARTAPALQVFLGPETAEQAFQGASVVAIPFRAGERPLGALAVIGPQHMNYSKVIPVVDFTADVLTEILSES